MEPAFWRNEFKCIVMHFGSQVLIVNAIVQATLADTLQTICRLVRDGVQPIWPLSPTSYAYALVVWVDQYQLQKQMDAQVPAIFGPIAKERFRTYYKNAFARYSPGFLRLQIL